MITLVVVAALNCNVPHQPIVKPKPIYTRQQRLKDSFDALAKQPISAGFLYELK